MRLRLFYSKPQKSTPHNQVVFRKLLKILYATRLCGDKVLFCKYNIEQEQTSRIAAKVEINGIDWKKELTEL